MMASGKSAWLGTKRVPSEKQAVKKTRKDTAEHKTICPMQLSEFHEGRNIQAIEVLAV